MLAAILLAGCHGSGSTGSFAVPEQLDESRQVELTFWAKNDTNKNQTAVYKNAIRAFEKLYPHITVNLRLYTDYGKIYNDVITNISTGTTPDVCITYPDHIATYLTGAGTVAPLDELMADARYGLGGSELRFEGPSREEMIGEYMQECMLSEHCYALPFMRSSEVCYVNETYVEKLGYELPEVLTWDFIWEVSEAAAATKKGEVYELNGQQVLIPFLYKSTDNMMITWLKQSGGAYSTAEGEIGLFDSPQTGQLLQEVSGHVQSGAFSTFKISGYPANFLNAGQCIFAVDSTAGSTWMGSEAPLMDISADKIVPFKTAVRPVPQLDPEAPAMMSQGPSVCVFNKEDPQQVLASWLFAQFLMTNEVQIPYAQTEGYVPVTTRARASEDYQAYLNSREGDALHYPVKLEASRLVLERTAQTFTTPVFNGSASLRDAAGALIEDTVKSTRRKKEINEAYLQELYEKTEGLYHLDEVGGQMSKDLGPLPLTARLLLGALGAAWVLIAVVVWRRTKKYT
ncbi:MAG: extracellular solute-binding protein [Lachnospiraceae bacterium]|nr:extracellular solute-binding protein [Lachnospiraceae bacterium]